MKRMMLVVALGGAMGSGTVAGAAGQPTPNSGMPMTPPPPVRSGMGENDSLARKQFDFRAMEKTRETYTSPQAIARCLVTQAKTEAPTFLGGEMTADPSFQKLQGALGGKYGGCVSSKAVNVRMVTLDGAIAQELLMAERPTLADRLPQDQYGAAKAFSTNADGLTVTSLGRCLAAYSPGLSYKFLSAPAQSAAEQQALQTLYASSPECGQAAVPAEISIEQQRSAVASGLYHWVHKG